MMLVAIDIDTRKPVNLTVEDDHLHVKLPPEQLEALGQIIAAAILQAMALAKA